MREKWPLEWIRSSSGGGGLQSALCRPVKEEPSAATTNKVVFKAAVALAVPLVVEALIAHHGGQMVLGSRLRFNSRRPDRTSTWARVRPYLSQRPRCDQICESGIIGDLRKGRKGTHLSWTQDCVAVHVTGAPKPPLLSLKQRELLFRYSETRLFKSAKEPEEFMGS